ncbi:hypothetical protein AGMMS49992_28460 [Clostridia bacterium]|nr:hypothetical protein AGMMS49992_28460 [Clostridia bacterium]
MQMHDKSVRFTQRLPKDLHVWARAAADNDKCSINYLAIRAIRELLQREHPDKNNDIDLRIDDTEEA